jgi:hypothetical protein
MFKSYLIIDRDISVGVATRYRLESTVIESQLGRDLPHLSRPALRTNQPPVKWAPRISLAVKLQGRVVDYPSPSRTEVKGRVELHV